VVRNAADLCGEMGLAEAVPDLVRQCHHEDERVRKAVAEALGRIGTPAALDGLRKVLLDPAAAVRVKALAHLSGPQARGMAGAIGNLLEREEGEEVRQEGLLALGRIATPEAVALLGEWAAPGGKLLGRRPLAIRLAAVRGLVLAGPAALNVLATLQRDELPELRQVATRAINALKP
jgi:HEAT repeat protein